jgi:hypothetical protein
MSFPVIERELKLASCQKRTYAARMVLVSVGTGLFLLLVRISEGNVNTGAYYFTIIQFVLFLFCAMEGVRATADCLSEEERQGTLGLLFLTRLTGTDVVLGKMVSSSLNSFYFLLGMFPLSGLGLLLGGVTLDEYIKTNVVLVCFLIFSLSCGIFVSSRSLKEGPAGVYTTLLILGACFFPQFLQKYVFTTWSLSRFSPFSLLWNNLSILGNSGPLPSLIPLFGLIGFSALLVGLAGWRLGKFRSTVSPRVKEVMLKTKRNSRFSLLPRLRQKWLDKEPVVYLFLRENRFIWLLALLVVANLAAGFLKVWQSDWFPHYWDSSWGNLSFSLIMGLVIYKTAAFFNVMRESGSLELLLTTPLSPKQIVDGVHRGVNRTLGIAALLVFIGKTVNLSILAPDYRVFPDLYLFPAIGAIANYYSLKWVAMAFGMTERKTITAFFKTAGVVFVLPMILVIPLFLMATFRGKSWNNHLEHIFSWAFSLMICIWASRKVKLKLANWSEMGSKLPVKKKFSVAVASRPSLPPPVPSSEG